MKPARALISVYDKRGVVDFATELHRLGVELVSTGGTYNLLKESGLPVVEVSRLTGFPEIMNGRVKTLHPLIHGGILADRTNQEHLKTMYRLGIKGIDIVAVNLYPFKDVVERGADILTAIENIDIGGPALIRASAKNYRFVTVVTDPEDYQEVIRELKETGEVSLETRFRLARKAFNLTAHYDALIAKYLYSVDEKGNPAECADMRTPLTLTFEKVAELRYGENPHQRGALYAETLSESQGVVKGKKLSGAKELSFNNIQDLDSALRLAFEFTGDGCACVIVKHANPCGVAVGRSPEEAYEKALRTDPLSAFGGIVAFNAQVNRKTAELMVERFYECVVAPSYTEEALEVLSTRKNLRVVSAEVKLTEGLEFRHILGGLLVQDADTVDLVPDKLKVVSDREPTPEEWKDLIFAFKVVKWVKSNAVVFAKSQATVGIGVGQTSRVDAVRCAREKARLMGLSLSGSVMASDAFFPFRDSVDEAAKAGVTAIIQPGGSIRDREVINSANEHGIAMVFTGVRHFRH